MGKFVSVGKILNFHGVKGEAKVGFSKNQQGFLLSLDRVFLQVDNNYVPINISSSKINKNFALIKFEGIDSINDLLPYKGKLIFTDEETIRENLQEDEFLIDELVGLGVYDTDGKELGFVVGVSNNGASDLLSVKTKTKNVCLIPFVKAIVTGVNLKEKKITINNLEGLLQ